MLALASVVYVALAQPTDPAVTRAKTFISTSRITSVPGHTANFSCPNNPAASSPCLSNPNKPLEMGGIHAGTSQDDSADVYLGCMEFKDGGSCLDVLNNYGAPGGGPEVQLLRVMAYPQGELRVWGDLILNLQHKTDARLTSDFGPMYRIAAGPLYAWNTASTDIETWFTGVGGTQKMVLTAAGFLDVADGPSSNVCTLDGASPSKCNVTTVAGARCTCSVVSTAGGAACTVNLVSTTLTAYSSNGLTNVVNVTCH